jgi:phenylacetic acid degradation operon negative regulatory protein
MFQPRAAMLTLYGDYVRHRGTEIGIGSLIKLLGNFGLSEQAIRSAVSRMCRQGLLKVRRQNRKSYYSLTENGHSLLNKGTQRIFQRKKSHWDGSWNIITYSIPERIRQSRDRLRLELSWMGYGPLSEATWISPYNRTAEVEDLASRLKIKEYLQMFQAKCQECTDPEDIVSRCWDMGKIHDRYARFIEKYQPRLEYYLKRQTDGEDFEPSECFVQRFNLIHEYRKLPFLDPDLPQELLHEGWLRPQAAELFDNYHNLLTDKANEYFDSVSRSYRNTRKTRTEDVKHNTERHQNGGGKVSASLQKRSTKRIAVKSK